MTEFPPTAGPPAVVDLSQMPGWFDRSQPLWLPRGSIRAILTLGILATTGILFLVWKWAPNELVALLIFTIKDYFVSRDDLQPPPKA